MPRKRYNTLVDHWKKSQSIYKCIGSGVPVRNMACPLAINVKHWQLTMPTHSLFIIYQREWNTCIIASGLRVCVHVYWQLVGHWSWANTSFVTCSHGYPRRVLLLKQVRRAGLLTSTVLHLIHNSISTKEINTKPVNNVRVAGIIKPCIAIGSFVCVCVRTRTRTRTRTHTG